MARLSRRDRDGAGLAVLAGILGMIALVVLAIAFGVMGGRAGVVGCGIGLVAGTYLAIWLRDE